MLINLKNIQKTYNTKTGVSFRAISNVSLSFDEKGMVFLLGKSGSGKTTLLNLIGGMDSIDSGAIYIGGKNLARLTTAEVDSYRNTMVGFVFQEFNLIDYMTVYENVKLAIDMQSGNDAYKVELALKQVDLLDKKHEKVKNLSGGQRQRVGIARAIVKNPDIILADEPTGALDSATGEEVMNIFESLSKEKLVIIVSHDAEKAVRYADRIIEMKDGTIYRDVRRKAEGEKIDYSQIHITSNTLVRLEKGVTLKDTDVKRINEILDQKGRRAYVNVDTNPQKIKAMFPNLREAVDSGDAKPPVGAAAKGGQNPAVNQGATSIAAADNIAQTKAAHITASSNGAQNAQPQNTAAAKDANTAIAAKSNQNPADNQNPNGAKADIITGKEGFVPYRQAEGEIKNVDFKKSKLPTTKALKIGMQNLKLKIGKMVVTTIIAVIAFALFATAVSFSGYDLTAAYSKTIKKSNIQSIMTTNAAGEAYRIKDNEVSALKKANPKIGVYNQYNLIMPDSLQSREIIGFNSIVEVNDAADLKLEMLQGSSVLPDFASIIISQAAAREYLRYGGIEGVNDYADLIGKTVTLKNISSNSEYKITGIFKTDLDKYVGTDGILFSNDINNFIEGVLIVKNGFKENHISSYPIENALSSLTHSKTRQADTWFCSLYSNTMQKATEYGIDYNLTDSVGGFYDYYEMDEYGYPVYADNPLSYDNYHLEDNEIFISYNLLTSFGIYTVPKQTADDNNIITLNDFNADTNKAFMVNTRKEYYGDYLPVLFSTDIKVKGIIRNTDDRVIIVSDNVLQQMVAEQVYTHSLMLVLSGDQKADTSVIEYLHANGYVVKSDFAYMYSNFLVVMAFLRYVIITVAILLCLLVIILMFTFISSSIKLTRKQIGILRALGARRIDTFKIYALEGIFIGVLSLAIAVSLLLIFAPIINSLISAAMGYYFSMLTIGLKDILSLFVLMPIVVAVSIFIPLRKFNKITPIKAIVEKE